MAVPTGTFFGQESLRIEEKINRTMENLLPSMCPVWRQHFVTSKNVKTPNGLGRDLKTIHTFQTGLAGVIRPGINNADLALYGDSDNNANNLGNRLRRQTQARSYPSALDGAVPKTFDLGINMNSMEANLPISLAELQADNMEAVIGQVIAPKIAGFARNMAQFVCNSWFLDEDDNFELAALPADVSAEVGASSNIYFSQTDSSGSVWDLMHIVLSGYSSGKSLDRFVTGQRVEIWNANRTLQATTASNTTVFFVHSVDELEGRITLVASDGSTLASDATTGTIDDGSSNLFHSTATFDGGSICYEGMDADANASNVLTGSESIGKGSAAGGSAGFANFFSVFSWLKGSGNLMGGQADSKAIDVDEHPEFKSLIIDQQNQDMTENRLLQIMTRFHTAKAKYGQTVDTLYATDGVWTAYRESMLPGREYYDRTGRVASLMNQGADGTFAANVNADASIKIEANGQSISGYTTNMLKSGQIIGIKQGGANWNCYIPPSRKGTSSFSQAEPFLPFQFIANALGGRDNMFPIFDTDAAGRTVPTEWAQMPGDIRMQLVPNQPAGIRINNVGESRLWAST